ncbi:unnamed protein product [Medioppia subpectinata]|uniref:F-box domain-containing protein n=1 Tax=Medioppia subpectinata TaxID=1979941 RepID=A0A7R9PUX1_9ACAR|nr:unnamed protein product [Medioppia subpectinata]CAG2102212.1 unnamed protein product [Medioppia subpectinata]
MHNRCLKFKTDIKLTQEMSQNYPKDSLDRFGDDMCEHILSYLTLEDRFRCECVSKQWRRLIYTTQTDFICTYSQTPFMYNELFVDYERIIRALLHKCVNLLYIEIRDHHRKRLSCDKIVSMHKIIAESIERDIYAIEWPPMGVIGRSLTEQIPSAIREANGLPLNPWIKQHLNKQYASVKLCVKLCQTRVRTGDKCLTVRQMFVDKNRNLFEKYRKFSCYFSIHNSIEFINFAQTYGHTLRSIAVTIVNLCDEIDIKTLMNCLSKMRSLRDVRIIYSDLLTDPKAYSHSIAYVISKLYAVRDAETERLRERMAGAEVKEAIDKFNNRKMFHKIIFLKITERVTGAEARDAMTNIFID